MVRSAEAVWVERTDEVAQEEPLEIRLVHIGDDLRPVESSLCITMRTPGDDADLAMGFLYAERIVRGPEDVVGMHEGENVITVELANDVTFDRRKLLRHFFTTSSCGVCGAATLEALEACARTPLPAGIEMELDIVRRLPDQLRHQQALFDRTAGVHAAGLFDTSGRAQWIREDVGRHNAVDKAVGAWLKGGGAVSVLVVSGRTSYEILQKAVIASIPIVVSVGAPSSLAVELAQRFGVTLVGFCHADRCNIYHGAERIIHG